MRRRHQIMLIATFVMAGRAFVLAQNRQDPTVSMPTPTVIRHAELNPDMPVFVPVHPRIATTISFPKPIGEPMGTGFIDAENLSKSNAEGKVSRAQGEYVIDYTQGDNFFTVQPTARSELLNLNVPYEGTTIVLYFYLVDNPLSALASLILQDKTTREYKPATEAAPSSIAEEAEKPTAAKTAMLPSSIQRLDAAPVRSTVVASPARLEGLLRKLRMVHAAQFGAELTELASALKVKVAVSTAEDLAATDIVHPVNDSGLYQLILLRAVRDPALDAVGFVLLLRNPSDRELIFDPRTFSARCGVALYNAQVVDAPVKLKPHETAAGYFIVVGAGDGRPGYLLPNNDWRISVALVAPVLPAGADLEAKKAVSK